MNVLHISKYYYPFIGGVEQVARDCVTALRKRGHSQKVICFNHEAGDCVDQVDGTEVIRAGCFMKVASQSLSLSYGRLLGRVFKEFQPDAVIFHYPNPFVAYFLLRELKKYPRCKLVTYWHLDITKQKILGKFFNRQTKNLLSRSAKIVATSPNYIEGSKFLPSFREKCIVIPNCVTESRMNVTEEDVKRGEEIRAKYQGKTICYAMGRHVPYKGMEYLVRASRYLDDSFAVLIAGQGELTESLKALAAEDKKVEFLGRVSDEQANAYISACDIFCFPSVTKNEAFGLALAEAMYQAKPAVTFTIEGSGVNYVSLNGVTGIEVENKNARAYAEAIEKLAKDEALRIRYGKAAKERVEENFTFNRFVDNIVNLTDSL